jgi:hypothetical protein
MIGHGAIVAPTRRAAEAPAPTRLRPVPSEIQENRNGSGCASAVLRGSVPRQNSNS